MNIQLDTNIVIDILEKREPFNKQALEFLTRAIENRHELSITANSIDNIFYILRTRFSPPQIRFALNNLFESVKITTVNEAMICMAIKAEWRDIEDCIQYYVAINSEIDLIITRNQKDYEENKIPILNPEEGLKWLRQVKE
ncbi:type II toxin-antitoxin system VapC family toxin [Owenweeksia hongkongensis]|uniref:type II toxin-antitoxin system VapC family toxin n=1 Tax=Owenweeksia hongkongensis TaxID=253245 RepID=UPI003A949DC3